MKSEFDGSIVEARGLSMGNDSRHAGWSGQ